MTLYPVPDEYATVAELADIMRCSKATIYRMKRDGMPHVTWGRYMLRFPVRESLAWAREQKREAA